MFIKTFGVVGIIVAVIILVALGPLALLCGINWIIEPFDKQVPYTFGTWFGAWLILFIFGTMGINKKKD